MKSIIVAVGANTRGRWGNAAETIARSLVTLRRAGVRIARLSPIYSTAPVGKSAQPRFLNAAIVLQTALRPQALYTLLKRIERSAGRRPGVRNGPRPLDLDIVDYQGRIAHWPGRVRSQDRLTLPHPEAHRRAFVLQPLRDVEPEWRHPVLRLTVQALLARLDRVSGDVDRAGP